jgi:hypothetical protein
MYFQTYVDINYFLLFSYEELIPEVRLCIFGTLCIDENVVAVSWNF